MPLNHLQNVTHWLHRSRIQVRIVTGFFALFFVVLAAIGWLMHRGLAERAVRDTEAQLVISRDRAAQALGARRLLLLRDAQALAVSTAAPQALRGDGPQTLARWLAERHGTPARDVALIDANHKTLMATSAQVLSPSFAGFVPSQPIAQDGWTPGASANQPAMQWAAAPVHERGFTGWVVLMAPLGAEQLSAWAAPGVRLAVQDGATASSAPPGLSSLMLALPGTGNLQLLMTASAQDALAAYAPLERAVVIAALAGLLAYLCLGAYTAHWVLSPVRKLAASVHRVGSGDYQTPVEVHSLGEIAELTQAIENMRQAICEREQHVHQLELHDSLTTLPNREHFRRVLQRETYLTNGGGECCSVIYLDLDRFKRINDVLGQRTGDRLLHYVATRLSDVVGPDAIVARMGGDEFAVLVHGHARVAQAVGSRIALGLRDARHAEEHVVDLSASLGIATCPDHGFDADLLLAHAERAMMTAKQRKVGMLVYDAEHEREHDEDIGLLSELRRAIEANQLRLVLQPKVELATGRVVGAEALVRWVHPERGELPPARFIPFAERTGAVSEVTRWMLKRAAMVSRRLQREGLELRVSVNLSTRDLLNRDLPRQIRDLIDNVKITPQSLVLEITESELMQDPERACEILQELHGVGVGLSIDDFGTGYSSLGYLKRLPVDELKIDKSFVMNMEHDVQDAKIVRSTVDLAHNLGLRVVAEGLESAKSWKLLAALDCDEGQGYFVAHPMDTDDFLAWLPTWSPPRTDDEQLATEFAALL